jgi:hypothetical protein
MLCELMDVSAEKILTDFINTVSMDREGLDEDQKSLLSLYFLNCKYGQERYHEDSITQMLHELQCVSEFYPEEYNEREQEEWKRMYYKYWFKRWKKG